MTDKKTLFLQLEKANIKRDDTLLMHSSMKAIGEFEGGADGLLDAFTEYLKDGLFILPSHTWDKVTFSDPFFNVNNSMPCVGILSRIATLRKEGVRSLNPTHSVVAFGKEAEEFTYGEEKVDTPTSPKGCYAKLIERDAKILLVGVGHEKNTFIHCLEEIASVPYRLTDGYTEFFDIDRNGVKRKHPMKEIYCPFHEDVSVEFPKLDGIIAQGGAERYCMIAKAKTIVAGAKKLAEVLLPVMEKSVKEKTDYLLPQEFDEYFGRKI